MYLTYDLFTLLLAESGEYVYDLRKIDGLFIFVAGC